MRCFWNGLSHSVAFDFNLNPTRCQISRILQVTSCYCLRSIWHFEQGHAKLKVLEYWVHLENGTKIDLPKNSAGCWKHSQHHTIGTQMHDIRLIVSKNESKAGWNFRSNLWWKIITNYFDNLGNSVWREVKAC